VLDGAIEKSATVEPSCQALVQVLRESTDDITRLTAACILHRIHLRESSRHSIPELVDYLVTQENYAGRAMLEWYLNNASQEVAPAQLQLLQDIRREQEFILKQRHVLSQTQLVSAARNRARVYSDQLAAWLQEQGMKNWRFRCTPVEQDLELTFGLGLCSITIPNEAGILEPCDVLLTAALTTRDQRVIQITSDLKYKVQIAPEHLQNVQLATIIATNQQGTRVLSQSLEKTRAKR
jgi:hypothetical protein